MKKSLLLSLLFLAPSAFAEGHNHPTGNKGFPLYKMAGRDVIVVKGEVKRVATKNPTGLVDRSIPAEDPSRQKAYHFELADFVFQKDLVKHGVAKGAEDTFFLPSLFLQQPAMAIAVAQATSGAESPESAYLASTHFASAPLLALNRSRYESQEISDGLALVNSDYEFYGISDRKFGYCWGYSTLARRLTMLAFFDPNLKAPVPAYVQDGLKKNQKWFEYYQKIIDKILLQSRPQVIPGFANIRELSMVPEIEFYLKLRAMDLWADVATHSSSIPMFLSGDKLMGDAAIKDLTRDLKNKTDRGELVKILFAAKNSMHILDVDLFWSQLKIQQGATDVHSVLVKEVRLNRDFTGQIVLWDINFYAEDYTRREHTIDIVKNKQGLLELRFETWFENLETPQLTDESSILGRVMIAPEYERESGLMLLNLGHFCKDPKTAQYCR